MSRAHRTKISAFTAAVGALESASDRRRAKHLRHAKKTRAVVVGKFPRTYIPLDAILSFEIESYGGDAPEAADEFDSPLERLHALVRSELAATRTSENAAANAGVNGDGLAARVDALDWVLQRIDKEMGR